LPNPDKPEPNTFYVWPQKTPLGREQLGLVFDPEAQTRRELVAERLRAERPNNTEGKNSFCENLCSSVAETIHGLLF
jgi:hypothetical protein